MSRFETLTIGALAAAAALGLWLRRDRETVVPAPPPVLPHHEVSPQTALVSPSGPASAPSSVAPPAEVAPGTEAEEAPLPGRDVESLSHPSAALVAGLQDGRWVTQGDVLVGENQMRPGDSNAQTRVAVLDTVQYWPGGVVPYVLDQGVDAAAVEAAVREIAQRTVVRFLPRTDEADYLVFRAADAQVCQSYLGRRGGEQDVLLHRSCRKGQIEHELMHALGFVHEQSREDRDRYLRLAWDEIKPEYRNQFQKLPASVSMPAGGPFDFGSVLLYPSNAFSRGGRPTMTKEDGTTFAANRTGLSELDAAKINALYGRLSRVWDDRQGHEN